MDSLFFTRNGQYYLINNIPNNITRDKLLYILDNNNHQLISGLNHNLTFDAQNLTHLIQLFNFIKVNPDEMLEFINNPYSMIRISYLYSPDNGIYTVLGLNNIHNFRKLCKEINHTGYMQDHGYLDMSLLEPISEELDDMDLINNLQQPPPLLRMNCAIYVTVNISNFERFASMINFLTHDNILYEQALDIAKNLDNWTRKRMFFLIKMTRHNPNHQHPSNFIMNLPYDIQRLISEFI